MIIPGIKEQQEHQLKTPTSTVNDLQTMKEACQNSMGESQVQWWQPLKIQASLAKST